MKAQATDLYHITMNLVLFQMRKPKSKALLKDLASVKFETDCLDELSRQCQCPVALRRETAGLGFHLSFQTLALTIAPLPQQTVVLFLRLSHSNYESLNLYRQKITPVCTETELGGMAYSSLFFSPFTLGSFPLS